MCTSLASTEPAAADKSFSGSAGIKPNSTLRHPRNTGPSHMVQGGSWGCLGVWVSSPENGLIPASQATANSNMLVNTPTTVTSTLSCVSAS